PRAPAPAGGVHDQHDLETRSGHRSRPPREPAGQAVQRPHPRRLRHMPPMKPTRFPLPVLGSEPSTAPPAPSPPTPVALPHAPARRARRRQPRRGADGGGGAGPRRERRPGGGEPPRGGPPPPGKARRSPLRPFARPRRLPPPRLLAADGRLGGTGRPYRLHRE